MLLIRFTGILLRPEPFIATQVEPRQKPVSISTNFVGVMLRFQFRRLQFAPVVLNSNTARQLLQPRAPRVTQVILNYRSDSLGRVIQFGQLPQIGEFFVSEMNRDGHVEHSQGYAFRFTMIKAQQPTQQHAP